MVYYKNSSYRFYLFTIGFYFTEIFLLFGLEQQQFLKFKIYNNSSYSFYIFTMAIIVSILQLKCLQFSHDHTVFSVSIGSNIFYNLDIFIKYTECVSVCLSVLPSQNSQTRLEGPLQGPKGPEVAPKGQATMCRPQVSLHASYYDN